MKLRSAFLALALALTVGACSEETSQDIDANTAAQPDIDYYVLDESLSLLKQDFNENKDKVRLLFIVGDTCGICLRGVADLNDAFIAKAQADDRLLTLVVHVPVLGAEERHMEQAIPLLQGPRIIHYWDETGISGELLMEPLQTNGVYAWDVWLAYGPNVEWTGDVPPEPDFWMHQLGPLDRELRLDAEKFGEMTVALMQQIYAGEISERQADESELLADGAVISTVAQPKGRAISTHIRGRGGLDNIKSVQSISRTGSFSSGGRNTGLTTEQSREEGLSRQYEDPEMGLPLNIETMIAKTWEFDGKLVDWEEKGHQARMSGMLKIGPSLSWKLFVLQANGARWALYVDSHTGDIVLQERLDDDGNLLYSIKAGDFREINGHRLPNVIAYHDSDGSVIATEEYSDTRISTL